ncbi:hypothetical protein GGX14DRAFT_696930 [Mycena pura]|uniref:Uncharacterized protein n=1 Tax=Mycena pura TaxID=153505 RepID=A0AAD6YEV1_9AGAR|nr:hypothetical protein GGX14DRAFT_696930 [Mycena pura]
MRSCVRGGVPAYEDEGPRSYEQRMVHAGVEVLCPAVCGAAGASWSSEVGVGGRRASQKGSGGRLGGKVAYRELGRKSSSLREAVLHLDRDDLVSLSPHNTLFSWSAARPFQQPRAPQTHLNMAYTRSSSTPSSSESITLSFPLPIPVSPKSLSIEPLGSNEILPRPKRGAPPVAPAAPKVGKDKKPEDSEAPQGLDPALCEGW